VNLNGRVRVYIAETASKRFMTFSLYNSTEENDYKYFDSYEMARKYISKKYNIIGRMKKVKS